MLAFSVALLFSEERFRVTGFDIEQQKVKTLEQGGSYIYRITPGEIQLARQQSLASSAAKYSLRTQYIIPGGEIEIAA